jgi:hypothetical protein
MGSTISTESVQNAPIQNAPIQNAPIQNAPIQKPSVPSRDTDGYRTLVKKLRQIQLEEQYVIIE